MTKVSLGEADAGIVYVTDVRANGGKTAGVAIPADQNATTTYPIAEIKGAPNATAAAAFISYVLGSDGQQVLKSFGFLPPRPDHPADGAAAGGRRHRAAAPYGRWGFIGRPLESATGVTLPFSLAGVVVAESFVAMPFFVITVESGLRSMNRRLEDAARSLGRPAGPCSCG